MGWFGGKKGHSQHARMVAAERCLSQRPAEILLPRASPASPASPALLREREAKEKTEKGNVRGGRKKIWVQHDGRAVDSLCHQVMWAGPGLWHGVKPLRSHRESRCSCLFHSFFFLSFFKWPLRVLGAVALNTSPAESRGPAYSHWAPMGSSRFLEVPQECSKQQHYRTSRARNIGCGKQEWFLNIKLGWDNMYVMEKP